MKLNLVKNLMAPMIQLNNVYDPVYITRIKFHNAFDRNVSTAIQMITNELRGRIL